MSDPPSSHDRDAEQLFETAHVLATAIPDGEFDGVRATLEYLYYSGRALTPTTLQSNAPCTLSRRAAEDIVLQLEIESILTENTIDDPALRAVFDGAELLATQPDPPENTILATLPDDPVFNTVFEETMAEPLLSHAIELIQSASDHLVLMSPFLSEEAYTQLRPALHTATGAGASISLITNRLTYDDRDYNRMFTHRLLDDSKLAPVTTCYEYINDDTWMTFHAKIIIADRERAYLGTANITHTGFRNNLELGVLFRDETVDYLATLIDRLEDSQFLHMVEQKNRQFVRV